MIMTLSLVFNTMCLARYFLLQN